MNIYMLVEGKAESKIYPAWIRTLAPNLSRVDSPEKARRNNFFLISGGGYPSLLGNQLRASVEDVNEVEAYDFLVICLDSDDETPETRARTVYDSLESCGMELRKGCESYVIVQRKCIETWCMGNRAVRARNPSPDFVPFFRFYDVSANDPELMEKPEVFSGSQSVYHYTYLKSMLAEKRLTYSKGNPKAVTEDHYVRRLKERVEQCPEHLSTLRRCFLFFEGITQTEN